MKMIGDMSGFQQFQQEGKENFVEHRFPFGRGENVKFGEENTALEITQGGGTNRSSRIATQTGDALKNGTPAFVPQQTGCHLIGLAVGHLFVDLRGSSVQRVHQIEQLQCQ